MFFGAALGALGVLSLWAAVLTWRHFEWIDRHVLRGRWERLSPPRKPTKTRDPYRLARGESAEQSSHRREQARLQLPIVLVVVAGVLFVLAGERIL